MIVLETAGAALFAVLVIVLCVLAFVHVFGKDCY